MNVSLTAEQLQAIRDGAAVRLRVPELAMECVVVRADLYARVQTIVNEAVGEDEVARLVEASMKEYDEDDLALEGYQQYRN